MTEAFFLNTHEGQRSLTETNDQQNVAIKNSDIKLRLGLWMSMSQQNDWNEMKMPLC